MIAGEPSGDKLGASLLKGLKQLSDIEVTGIGGSLMTQQGLKSLFPMSDLSIMGLFEILPKIPMLLRRVRLAADHIIETKPDVLITIDSPDFCLRVAKRVRAAHPDIKIVHYVAPSVWAWRPERAVKMAKYVDHVLALLPIEPPLMRNVGMTSDFVGHPVVSENAATSQDKTDLIESLGLDITQKIVTILPGSRAGEIKRMAPIFGEVTAHLASIDPKIQFILPAAGPIADMLFAELKNWTVVPHVLDPRGMNAEEAELRKRTAYAISDAAVATSGTVALELAGARCPMVVAYKANWMTTRTVKRMALIDTANLVNIITDTRTVPECLFENCTSEQIISGLAPLLTDSPERAAQVVSLENTMAALDVGDEDQGLVAARSVLSAIRPA
jgi:lipid-A-disaccharide synthase